MSSWVPVVEQFIEIDGDACTGCGNCIVICGAQVFEMRENTSVAVRIEDCLECGNCEVVCEADALIFRVPGGGTGIIYECG